MKINEEYAIAESRDDLIDLDRKTGKLSNTRPNMDDFFKWFEKNAPLKLRKWVRELSNEDHHNIRHQNKNKKRRPDSPRDGR